MQTSKLADLRPGKSADPIEIRVLRKWETKYREGQLSLVLIDEEGTPIQVCVDENNKEYIDSHLHLMSCYRLSGYICTGYITFMKVIERDVSLRIGQATQIVPIADTNDIPRYYFHFHNFESLKCRCDKKEMYTDYIGTVERTQEGYTKRGDPYLRVTLRNESNEEISLAIWKESLPTFNRDELNNAPYPAVLAASSTKVTFNGQIGQSQLGTSDASYIYINPNTPATTTLQNRSPASTAEALNTQNMMETNLLILTTSPTESITGKTHRCVASIDSFILDKGWYYCNCPNPGCNIILLAVDDRWACPTHGIQENPIYMYRVKAIIMDPLANTNVIMFDQSCSTLVNESNYTNNQIIPDPLLDLIGKPLNFSLYKAKNTRFSQTGFTATEVTKTAQMLLEPPPTTAPQTPTPKIKRLAPASGSEEAKKKLKLKEST